MSLIPDGHGNLLEEGDHGVVLIHDGEKLPQSPEECDKTEKQQNDDQGQATDQDI
jgi:hypothetical protein